MTVSMIDCQRFDDLLSEYLESTLSLPSRAAMDAHAAACARCAAWLADVRSIVDRAGALPVLQPPRDLWPAVAARLDAPVVPITAAASAQRSLRMPRWVGLAAAAAVLIVATSLVTREATRSGAPEVSGVVETPRAAALPESLGAESTTTVQVAETPFATPAVPVRERATVTYGREIARLETIVRQRESALDPATLAIIENSLHIIDSAIVEARAALARDPASRFLTGQVDKTLQKKMELLRSVTLIAART
ncbi:MAG: zf-HC2 domain-containing protein [Gemmatimonadaceae bacterium]